MVLPSFVVSSTDLSWVNAARDILSVLVWDLMRHIARAKDTRSFEPSLEFHETNPYFIRRRQDGRTIRNALQLISERASSSLRLKCKCTLGNGICFFSALFPPFALLWRRQQKTTYYRQAARSHVLPGMGGRRGKDQNKRLYRHK